MNIYSPPTPENEEDRLHTLDGLLSDFDEELFDAIAKVAARICQTPIGLVSLITKDEQRVLGASGMGKEPAAREETFCAHTILDPDSPFVVLDASQDFVFKNHPAVESGIKVRLYAGVSINVQNQAVGTLCVVDGNAHSLSQGQIESLNLLGKLVEKLLEGAPRTYSP